MAISSRRWSLEPLLLPRQRMPGRYFRQPSAIRLKQDESSFWQMGWNDRLLPHQRSLRRGERRYRSPTFTQNGREVDEGIEISFTGDVVPSLHAILSVSFINSRQRSTGIPDTEGKSVSSVPSAAERVRLELGGFSRQKPDAHLQLDSKRVRPIR